ncbi:MAG: hypothetical protein KJP22_01865 [Acidimicrobiia bacterium]|nr:hypothetical protein [Acidimicrobiia bacterium]
MDTGLPLMKKPAKRWLVAAGLVGIAAMVVVAAVVIDATSNASQTSRGLPVVLSVPNLGETAAAVLSDGHPVFVVHDLDGSVEVIEAVSTHLPDDPMGWCPTARTIDDVAHGARWDPQGRYESGPGATDLGRYQIEIAEDSQTVEVVAYIEPSSKSDTSAGLKGPWCDIGGYQIHSYYLP